NKPHLKSSRRVTCPLARARTISRRFSRALRASCRRSGDVSFGKYMSQPLALLRTRPVARDGWAQHRLPPVRRAQNSLEPRTGSEPRLWAWAALPARRAAPLTRRTLWRARRAAGHTSALAPAQRTFVRPEETNSLIV